MILPAPKSGGWIGVDLDGTLAKYQGWQGITAIGEPIPLMVQRVKAWLANGTDVRIFTARVGPGSRKPDELPATIKAIEEWCLQHIGAVLPVTATKDFGMLQLWDDRAVQVIPNTGEIVVGYSTI
jgi:hypothetical protein